MDGSKQQAHATGQDNDNDNARLHGTLPAIQTVNKITKLCFVLLNTALTVCMEIIV